MDVTPFIAPLLAVIAFVAGGIFTAVVQDRTARNAEGRAAAREAATRIREWNRTRIVETRRLVLAWTEWIADVVREGDVRDFSMADHPNGNLVLLGDVGAEAILQTLPIDLDEPKADALARLGRLRHVLLQLLDAQERRALQDMDLEPLMKAELSARVSALPRTFRVMNERHEAASSDVT